MIYENNAALGFWFLFDFAILKFVGQNTISSAQTPHVQKVQQLCKELSGRGEYISQLSPRSFGDSDGFR